ncbi:hypothetical protein BJ508DRAFT_315172 [Ascobolus immersus RN42]|uniref:Uncharacterized protein n=1 Tax=Ascobolus immersus RN42 TaxID=1160509 RepID=A0A3N4HGI1_ASCIM|nr:hypothetical protein BJ508DRAFT_315172 [Ascobolus immersus RN42]
MPKMDRLMLDSATWEHFEETARIVFQGTTSKRFYPDQTPSVPQGSQEGFSTTTDLSPSVPIVPAKHATSLPTRKTKSREPWLDGEPMRALLAAFIAEEWAIEVGSREDLELRMDILEAVPDLQPLVLAYWLIPGDKRLKKIPRADFGLTANDHIEKDWGGPELHVNEKELLKDSQYPDYSDSETD